MGRYGSPTRPPSIDYEAVGIGAQIVCMGLWRLACWTFRLGAATARRMRASYQQRTEEPSISLTPPGVPSFELWAAQQETPEDDAPDAPEDDEEPEPEPELLMRSEDAPPEIDPDPEPRRFDMVREANGTVVLRYRDNPHMASELRTGEERLPPTSTLVRLEEPSDASPEPRARVKKGSRYHRKLIPPGSFNRDGLGVGSS
jgi:hypothetical protein